MSHETSNTTEGFRIAYMEKPKTMRFLFLPLLLFCCISSIWGQKLDTLTNFDSAHIFQREYHNGCLYMVTSSTLQYGKAELWVFRERDSSLKKIGKWNVKNAPSGTSPNLIKGDSFYFFISQKSSSTLYRLNQLTIADSFRSSTIYENVRGELIFHEKSPNQLSSKTRWLYFNEKPRTFKAFTTFREGSWYPRSGPGLNFILHGSEETGDTLFMYNTHLDTSYGIAIGRYRESGSSNKWLYFQKGREVWRTDGTRKNTTKLGFPKVPWRYRFYPTPLGLVVRGESGSPDSRIYRYWLSIDNVTTQLPTSNNRSTFEGSLPVFERKMVTVNDSVFQVYDPQQKKLVHFASFQVNTRPHGSNLKCYYDYHNGHLVYTKHFEKWDSLDSRLLLADSTEIWVASIDSLSDTRIRTGGTRYIKATDNSIYIGHDGFTGRIKYNLRPIAVTKQNPRPKNKVRLYPNPVKSTLYVSGFEDSSGTQKVYNMNGRLVLKANLNSGGLSVSPLTNGVYLLRLSDGTVKHFVVAH